MGNGFWTPAKIIVVSVFSLVFLTGGLLVLPLATNSWWAATAPAISKMQETQQVYTAQNRITQYNKFYDEYSTYQTDLQTVKDNEKQLATFNKEHTASQVANDPTGNLTQLQGQYESSVTGAQEICTEAANAFNNDSRKVQTGAQFKGVDLSQQVDVKACNK